MANGCFALGSANIPTTPEAIKKVSQEQSNFVLKTQWGCYNICSEMAQNSIDLLAI